MPARRPAPGRRRRRRRRRSAAGPRPPEAERRCPASSRSQRSKRVVPGARHREVPEARRRRGPARSWTPVSKPAGPVIRQEAPAIGLATPWSGFSQARSKSLTRCQPSPPASASDAGGPAGCCRSGPCAGGRQPTLPAKSVSAVGRAVRAVAEARSWRSSAQPPPAVSQGRIVVARHSPPIITLAQGYSVSATRAPSMQVSPKRTPAADVGAPELQAAGPRAASRGGAGRRRSTRSGTASSSIVIVSARTADHEPGSRLHDLLSARAQSSRSSNAHCGGEKPAAKSRGVVSVVAAPAKTSKPPSRSRCPIRCSMPSWRACHQVPLTRLMPVPGGAVQRQRAKRVPETVRCPSRVKLFRWAPSKGSAPAGVAQ